MTKIKIDAEQAKAMLTPTEALELLAPHKERNKLRVHTFMGMGFALMGCDMDLKHIKAIFKKAANDDITLSGANMRGMGHGVAFFEEGKGWTFLETDKAKIDAIYKLRNIK